MVKLPHYVLRQKLAELSGVNYETVKKYSDLGLLDFVGERPRRYKTRETVNRLMAINELKENGYRLEMIKEQFTFCKDCGHSQAAHKEFVTQHKPTDVLGLGDNCSECNCKKFK